MIRRQQSQDMDEHDQPTEPVPKIILPPSSTTIPGGVWPFDDEVIPAPQPHERPFPQQDVRGVPHPGSPYRPPETPVYPYLPSAPAINQGYRPPGGAVPIQPEGPGPAIQSTQPRRSPFPLLVGLFFVAVQLLLLIRFVLRGFDLPGTTPWVGAVYAISNVFVQPFNILLPKITLPLPGNLEVYTLLAILLYGLLSRILVRFLKALLYSH